MSKCRILPPNHQEVMTTIALRYTERNQSSESKKNFYETQLTRVRDPPLLNKKYGIVFHIHRSERAIYLCFELMI